jgi:transcriptional regulator of acetoin/glycerol metabolism
VDVGLLIASLLSSGKMAVPDGLRFHREAARALLRYDWPMNVRELEQCLRASIVLADDGMVRTDDLPAPVAGALEVTEDGDAGDEPTPREEEIRRDLLVRLADARGNVSEVARAMGKARQQVQRWIRRFGIDPEAFRGK